MKKLLLLLFLGSSLCYAQPRTISLPDSVLKDVIYMDEQEMLPDSVLDLKKVYLADAEYVINDFNDELDSTKLNMAVDNIEWSIKFGMKDAFMYFEKGRCEMLLKKYSDAIASFSACVQMCNPSTQKIFLRKGTYGKTTKGYYEVIQSSPLWWHPYHALIFRGDCKRFLEDYRGAIDDYTKSLLFTKDYNADIYYARGYCKFNIKNNQEAKADLTQAIKLKCMDVGYAYRIRGACNLNLGLKEAACKDWSKAGELGEKGAYDDIKEYCN